MYCNSCGKIVENGAVFCTGCGKRINEAPSPVSEQTFVPAPEFKPPVTEENVPASENKEPPSLLDMMDPIQKEPSFSTEAAIPAPQSNRGIYEKEPPVMPYVPDTNKSVPEKTYFGKGALAFCLVVIGLLAISTGVFAGLYFSLL